MSPINDPMDFLPKARSLTASALKLRYQKGSSVFSYFFFIFLKIILSTHQILVLDTLEIV